MTAPSVLVIAGEASGDRIAAATVRTLVARGASCFGVGGEASQRAGMRLVTRGSSLAAMGIGDVARRAPAIAEAAVSLVRHVLRDPPRAALLVNFTEMNAIAGRLLRRRGVRVLWCVAPQVWAWRPGRLRSLRDAVDRLAVILPFEETLWRGAGYDARYVGHPSLDIPKRSRADVRRALGIAEADRAVAIAPGSRPGEIARLAEPLCAAARRLLDDRTASRAVVLRAPSLDPSSLEQLTEIADRYGLETALGDPDHGAAPLFPAFDLTLAASGTACLEAALAGAPPVVVYRLDRLAFAVARRLVRTPYFALPNVVLGRSAVPELVQDDVTPARIADAARRLLDGVITANEGELLARELEGKLASPSTRAFGERVAEALEDWLR